MNCNTLNTIEKECTNNIGGIKNIYALPYHQLNEIEYLENNPNKGLFELIIVEEFKLIHTKPGTSSYEVNENLNKNKSLFKHSLSFSVLKRKQELNENLYNFLSNNGRCLFLIELRNGSFVLLGLQKGMKLDSNNGGSGTNISDGTSYNISVNGEQPYNEIFIDKDFVENKGLI